MTRRSSTSPRTGSHVVRTLDLGDVQLPLDLVTESNAILGKKGSGKTTAGIDLFEEIYGVGVPVISIDPKGDHWGVRSGADGTPGGGLPVPVFGGLHGDLPLEPESGEYLADLLRGKNLSAVLDVSEFSTAERRKFLTAFVNRLYGRPDREPMHLLIEEAHEVIPQRVDAGDAPMVGAFERLVKLGRFKGIGVTMLSQRSASLNKNVLTQVDNLFMLRTVSPQDRAAVRAWIETHSESSAIIDSLPSLATGECWLWQPERGEPLKFRFRQRRTYDAGTTPRVGETPRPTATLTDIDLRTIKTEMAATIERAKAEDPKTLRRRIAQLEKELVKVKSEPAAVADDEPAVVEVPVLAPEAAASLEAAAEKIREYASNAMSRAEQAVGEIREQVETVAGVLTEIQRTAVAAVAPPIPVRRTPILSNVDQVTSRRPDARTSPATSDRGAIKLGKTERTILTVLIQHGPMSHDRLALLSGYSPKASTIGVSLAKLRRAGFVADGKPITATQEGIDGLGDAVQRLPAGRELVDYWRNRFGLTEQRVLDAVLHAYPNATSQAEIAEITGYSPTASTIGVALSRLRKVGVVNGWAISDDFAEVAGL